jgi:hypothetical protein
LKLVRQELSASQEALEESKALVAKLEDDIAKGFDNMNNNTVVGNLLQVLCGHYVCILIFWIQVGALPVPQKTTSDDGSMLKIVCGQRDRFKVRILELESVSCTNICASSHNFFARKIRISIKNFTI